MIEAKPNRLDLVLTGSQRAAAAVVSTFKFPLLKQPTKMFLKIFEFLIITLCAGPFSET